MDNLPFRILTVAYATHILEEYVLDWHKRAQETSKLKLEWTEFFIANFAIIVLGISCSVINFDCPVFSYVFIPICAWAYSIALRKGILTISFILITSGIALLIMLFPVFLQIIKHKILK